jgi:hypothetical protein
MAFAPPDGRKSTGGSEGEGRGAPAPDAGMEGGAPPPPIVPILPRRRLLRHPPVSALLSSSTRRVAYLPVADGDTTLRWKDRVLCMRGKS